MTKISKAVTCLVVAFAVAAPAFAAVWTGGQFPMAGPKPSKSAATTWTAVTGVRNDIRAWMHIGTGINPAGSTVPGIFGKFYLIGNPFVYQQGTNTNGKITFTFPVIPPSVPSGRVAYCQLMGQIGTTTFKEWSPRYWPITVVN